MDDTFDLRQTLARWPYDGVNNVRLARGTDGRAIMLIRQPIGFDQLEVDGRPDGQRPHGRASAFDFQLERLAAAKQANAQNTFRLTAKDCAELFDESLLYCQRFANFFHLKDWARAESDTARTLHLLDFIKRYAEHVEDRLQFEQWRPDLSRTNAFTRVMILLEKGLQNDALQIARDNVGEVENVDDCRTSLRDLSLRLVRKLQEYLTIRRGLRPREESVFRLEGDYWTLTYQGQTARLQATRGLHWIACLLRHRGREFHVSELIAAPIGAAVSAGARISDPPESEIQVVTRHAGNFGSILDARAKAEYRRQLQDLREDLEEAERLGNRERAALAQNEMSCIAEQLASAVGLGGRDRRTGSEAERARSAVTKRIKESITRIEEVLPALGRHLATRIKTGYFCSYNPHPDRPVAWQF